jgi:hypothetical protein
MNTYTSTATVELANMLPSPEADPRITMSELCRIAKVSRVTVMRRAQAGKYPKPIDRGREFLFDRRAAYVALGILQSNWNHVPEENPFERAARVLAERESAPVRRRKTA